MSEFDRNIPAESKPEYFKTQMKKYGTAQKWADELFSKSIFADRSKVEKLLKEDASQKILAKDRKTLARYERKKSLTQIEELV